MESSSPLEAAQENAEEGVSSKSRVQKSLVYNRHLPYYSRLPDEASLLLEEIKVNLSAAVQKWELWPGALYWTNRLSSYIRIYGYQFSKADHLSFVRLLFELVTIPNLESPLVHTWANMLGRLLKKWRLLTPEDLTLPWRPVYQLVKQVFHSQYKQLGMKIYSVHACNAVHYLVSQVRNYFSLESTQEMLEEWRPLLCPFDMAMVESMNLLSEMLPTTLPPQHHNRGFKLWFEEFLHLWLGIHATTAADEFCVKLFVRLAKHNIGHVNWTPYLPQIFTRILRSFHLPVGPKELQTGSHQEEYLDASKAAVLIVSLLGGGSHTQEHLDSLMLALESYYHPSNVGKHTRKLLHFLKELSQQFVVRLKKERHSKPGWFLYIPDSAKLTEADIDAFVRCLVPVVRMAVFSKAGTGEAALTLHNLALVRPEMVLPDLLNRTYAALETLTEPHQLTATLQCVSGVSRTLLDGGRGRYIEGRAHLFSLLTLALPGIDPNDFRKTLVSGMLISALVSLIPLVDCSPAIGCFEMTEEEVQLCSLTSQFEDFVFQFFDRCFALVENTRLEQATALDRIVSIVSLDNHESIMGLGVAGSVHSVLVQCSPKLFEVCALDKLYRFATSHVFESEVAGRMCSDMCAAAAKVDAVATLKLFIPHCVRTINMILEDPDQRESEHPDNDLIWNIQLLSHILHGHGEALLSHADVLVSCLKNCVHLKCKSAALHAAKALGNALHCLTMTYPCESRSLATDFSKPPEEHLYIRNWSEPGDLDNLGLEWHVPSVNELQMTDRLLEEFLQPEFDRLQAFMEGEAMDRDSLHQSLQLVWYLLLGTAAYLPMWKGEQVEGSPSSVVNMTRDGYVFGPENSKLPKEQFSRENIAKFVHRLSEHILETCEDDTKSMFSLVQILKLLLTNFGVDKSEYDNKWHGYKHTKLILEDKLRSKGGQIRPMLILRIDLQHDLRILERSMSILTPLHHTLMKDLFRMAVSTYAEVRIKAQNALTHCLDTYLYSGRTLLPDVFPLLSSDNGVSHEQFKGALHVMLLPPVLSVYLHDWPIMKKALPLIVKADHSEKPSIQNLMNRILKETFQRYDYFTLEFQVTDGCLAAAASLHPALSPEEVGEGRARTEKLNQESVSNYEELVGCLVNLVDQGKLHWQYSQMAAKFLVLLIRHDRPFPVSGVKLLVNSLNHEYLSMRKLALNAMSLILLQQKRVHVKVPVDIPKEAGMPELDTTSLPPGEREDNKWLLYNADNLPRTEQEWNAFTFIDKTHWGYYAWPRTLYTYAPYDQQPPLDRKPEELSEAERVVYDAFMSPEFVDRLVSFLSLEENKGKDKYNTHRFSMFKGLFRNFGATFVPLLRPHLEKLAVDSQESCQRCASEIIAGMLSGSKLWSFKMVQEMWTFMEPLMGKVLDVIAPETVDDWAAAITDISANRDPRRLHWLLELMIVNPLHGTNGSFLDASRLYLLQSLLAQQEWRVPSLQNRILEYLKPLLNHPFKNVRERIGSFLAQIFLHDVKNMQMKFNPRRADFVKLVSPHLPTVEQLATVAEDKSTLQLCKTVLVWLIMSYQHSEPEHFRLLAELLPLTTIEDDDEMGGLIKMTCAQLSHAEVPQAVLPVVLSSTKKAIETGLWKVRVIALQMIQVLVFENLFVFGTVSEEVTELLLRLIGDAQMEVREMAASTVSGLVRCGYISCVDRLKILFVKQARIKLPKKTKAPNSAGSNGDTGYEGLLVRRHSGVLGLAALVEACPYSVPDWLPEVLDEMALHLHDPAPIQGTVKRAMSEFRRTHYDSWSEHKQKFTDDQLAVLADLLISPSYYA